MCVQLELDLSELLNGGQIRCQSNDNKIWWLYASRHFCASCDKARRSAHAEIDAEGVLYASAAPPREKKRGESEPCHTDSKTAVTYKTPCIGCKATRRCEAVIIPDEVTFGDTLR